MKYGHGHGAKCCRQEQSDQEVPDHAEEYGTYAERDEDNRHTSQEPGICVVHGNWSNYPSMRQPLDEN